jgi:hypothetical protein
MNCPNCGYQNAPGNNFCENCGAGLRAARPQVVYSGQRPGCVPGNFFTCLNYVLAFSVIAFIFAAFLIFFCVLDIPSPPRQSALPNLVVDIWSRMDVWQENSCSRPAPDVLDDDDGGAVQPKPAPKDPEDDVDDGNGDNGDEEDCNRSKFVSETIPDHTDFEPGEKFTKSWTVRNEGTCTWTTDYTFRFTQGDRIDGPKTINLPHNVAPGETITIEIDLTAPDNPGTYTGRWEFFDEQGDSFGWYSVVIDVVEPGAPLPLPDATVLVLSNTSEKCTDFTIQLSGYGPNEVVALEFSYFTDPARYSFNDQVTTDDGGNATYVWYADVTDGGQYELSAAGASAYGSAVFMVFAEDDCECGAVCIQF